ncbi:patatin-like phospholipase family protein [Melittangium boletus]|uniref:patatin-like phospholipase family protein n=1 Tax=Melittangium boletus TaxID=83453 RepID=UPI003DA56537
MSRSPLLIVLQLLVLCLVWGTFDVLGLSSLFFHDVPRVTFVAGFMAAMVLGQLCFVGYLLDADESWALAARGVKRAGQPPTLGWYLFRTGIYPVLLAVLSVPGFTRRHFAFLFGILAALGTMVLITRGTEALQRWSTTGWSSHRRLRRIRALLFRRRPTHIVVLHVLQAWLLGLFVAGYLVVALTVAITGYPGWVSPAVVICVAVGLVGASYGALRFFFAERYLGSVLLVGTAVLFFGRACADISVYDELTQPHPPAYAVSSLKPSADAGLLGDAAVLDAWLAGMWEAPPAGAPWRAPDEAPPTGEARCGGGEARPRLALVATSGGGIRAAAWTAHVLARLQGPEGVPDFHRYVRLVTGASGGMVGAGTWVTGLEREGLRRPESLPEMMERDSLSAAAIALLLPFGLDRGRSLERAWVDFTDGRLGRSFASLQPGERAGWLPSLVYSPMIVEDGRRLLVSNLDLMGLTSSEGSLLTVEHGGDQRPAETRSRLSLSSVQLFQLFPQAQPRFTVASAARMSASFPFMSPASTLPTAPRVRIVDAGYYDNYGVDLAVMWLHAHREWIRACTSGVLLIQIRDHLGNGRRATLPSWLEDSPRGGGLTSPVEAVLRARESSMSFRNDEVLSVVQDELNVSEPCFFTTATFEFNETAPLSWALTKQDTTRLRHAADSATLATQVTAVREWLTASPGARAHALRHGLCPGQRDVLP